MQIYFYKFGNLADFYLGTWLVFTWELGWILLGNLDGFCLGTWLIFAWELGWFLRPICVCLPQKEPQCIVAYRFINHKQIDLHNKKVGRRKNLPTIIK